MTLQHRLQVIRHLERRSRLALDLVHRHALRDLPQSQALRGVDIKHREIGDDLRDAAWPCQWECAF